MMKKIMVFVVIIIALALGYIYIKSLINQEEKFLDEQNYINLTNYNVYGESINLEIDNKISNEISLMDISTHEITDTIQTEEELDLGITPLAFSSGDYYLLVDNQFLTGDDVAIDFTTTPKAGQYYNISLTSGYNNVLILSKIDVSSSDTCDIMIDPGHGGDDGGAIALDLTEEADYNLSASLILADKLSELGYNTCLTREEDINPGNLDGIDAYGVNSRTGQVYEQGAKYLISMHYNTGLGEGFEIYSSVFASTNFARSIGEQISKVATASNLMMDDVVDSDYAIIQRYHDESSVLTDYMYIIRETAGRAIYSTNEDTNIYYDSIYGTQSLLIENGYLDSYTDLANAQDPEYMDKYLELLAIGIDNYIQSV